MRNVCKSLGLITALALPLLAASRPVIIEESARLRAPDTTLYQYFGQPVATNGEYALVGASRTDYGGGNEIAHYYALLYRRVGGQWIFQQELRHEQHEYDSYTYPMALAMKGDLAAVELNGNLRPYRLTASGWVQENSSDGPCEEVEVDAGRILCGLGGWDGRVHERLSNGTWSHAFLPGQPRCCDDEFWGGPVDISGNRVILGTPYVYDLEPQEIPIYQRTSPGLWQLLTKLQVPADTFRLGADVTIRGDDAFVVGGNGAYVWRLSESFGEPVDRLLTLGGYVPANYTNLEKHGEFVAMLRNHPDLGAAIHLFRLNDAGRYEEAAVLVTRDRAPLSGLFEITGNTVIAGGSNASYVFDLPAALAATPVRRENFENGSAAAWTALAGAQFSIATRGTNRVLRQSSTTGDARALLNGFSAAHQAIEADIRPTAFGCSDCWVGLMTRYRDAQNFYYATLRGSGTVQLRRMRGGVFTTLASAPLAVTVNRNYRVRLESIGNTHSVYVDGIRQVQFSDPVATGAGSAGITMYRARADFDNVVASGNPRTTLYRNDFASSQGAWTFTGAGQWTQAGGVFSQSSVTGDARAAIGTPTDDQVVEARVRPTSYAAPQGTQERWSGLIARYRDAQNYYYVTLRSGGTVSLRKLTNGAITTLTSAPLNVSLGTTYLLRLEAVGNQLRVFVNGDQLLQAQDGSHPSGSGGLVTYKTAVTFDDYVAYQP